MNKLSSYQRSNIFKLLGNERLDVLVIGGGITGAGIALDAVTRGLKTGLVEMQDFASGTSGRSTKLIHGGLRYLKQFEFKLVSEVGKERAIVYENGPHVTTPEWMLLPFYKGGTFSSLTANIGLTIYDYLAGVKKTERRKMFSPEEALKKEPLLNKKGLKGAGYYVEYKTDDARLTIEVIKKAVENGTFAVNYAKVIELIYNEFNKVIGVVVKNLIRGETYKVYAKKIINATGPWVDKLREIDGSKQGKTLHLTKGIHLVFSKKIFPLQQAIYFDTQDERMIFAIPRKNKTYIGTTDTNYKGDIGSPLVTKEDRDYLLLAINNMFPTLKVIASEIESSWVGLRPLIAEEGKDPNEISRKDEIITSETGLFSMAGGKLTGYRKMAEKVIDVVVEQIKVEEGKLYSRSMTSHLPISGGNVGGSKGFEKYKRLKINEGIKLGISKEEVRELIQSYGSNIDTLFLIYQEKQEEASRENIDAVVFSKLIYAIENELIYKPEDFFIRRTGALFFDIDWVNKYKDCVINYMEKVLDWDSMQTKIYKSELDSLLFEASTPQA